jgi:methyltransferase
MVSQALYEALLLLTAAERGAELLIGRRNAAWSLERGGVERGRGHWPFMVTLHAALLLGCAFETRFAAPAFLPWLGWPMLALALACQGLRWWCIASLGRRWNPRVIVIPGMPPVRGGPYRFFAHPNYVAVVLEGVSLPLIHGAWRTALLFSVLNAALLTVRIRCENQALEELGVTP